MRVSCTPSCRDTQHHCTPKCTLHKTRPEDRPLVRPAFLHACLVGSGLLILASIGLTSSSFIEISRVREKDKIRQLCKRNQHESGSHVMLFLFMLHVDCTLCNMSIVQDIYYIICIRNTICQAKWKIFMRFPKFSLAIWVSYIKMHYQ